MSDILSWIWLSTKFPIASSSIDALMTHFDYNADAVYNASSDDYLVVSGLDAKYIDALNNKSLDDSREIFDWCTENDVGLLPYDSRFYPQRLRDIEKAPILLYYRGRLINFDDNVCIALVGTRRMTDYGKREGYRIARDLILGGAVVVSGMARGIDTICHRGALDAGGYTVAVLGCGIDKVYPPENDYIMDEIARTGLVLTEFKPFTPPIGSNFPIRNRIISGLSLGTLVVEADSKSGAMITAKYAEKQGRDIFSIPGNVGELNSIGTNRLLKKGAKIVTGALDMLEEYEYIYPHRIRIENLPAFMPKFSSSGSTSVSKVSSPKKPITSNAPNEQDFLNDGKASDSLPFTEEIKLTKESKEIKETKKVKEVKKKASTEDTVKKAPVRDTSSLNETEKKIYDLFPEDRNISADEIARTGIPVGIVLQNLTMLEIKGFIKTLPGGVFTKA
ncbi:MAG: DNA-protecting protein DprA [Ruminococcaceae bacterium]|nr:DNA-protecting protein DprA [Oscillospiraceae bacterium]